jgi:hypothetical protein
MAAEAGFPNAGWDTAVAGAYEKGKNASQAVRSDGIRGIRGLKRKKVYSTMPFPKKKVVAYPPSFVD